MGAQNGQLKDHSGYSTEEVNGILYYKFSGDLDLHWTPGLTEQVLCEVTRGNRKLVFDLSEVSFIGVALLRTLIRIQKEVQEGPDSGIAIVFGKNDFLNVFRMTGLDQAVTLCETREEALKRFG